MQSSRVESAFRKQSASLDVGRRFSSCLASVAFVGFLALGVVAICRPRVASDQGSEPRGLTLPERGASAIRELGSSAGGERVVVRLRHGRFLEWSVPQNRLIGVTDLADGSLGDLIVSTLSADGTTLAAGFRSGSVSVRRDQQPFAAGRHAGPITALACSADGLCLASAAASSLAVWRAEPPMVVWSREDAGWDITRLVLSADGERLVAIHAQPLVHVWDVPTARVLNTFHVSAASVACLSTNGEILATADHSGDLELRSTATGRVVACFDQGGARYDSVMAAAFSPDGLLLATARSSGVIELWDVAVPTRAKIGGLPATEGMSCALQFTDCGRTLLSGGLDATICAWDLDLQEQASRIELAEHLRSLDVR
ncbi:MAG TPA: WD40 repeat domain-containing protein [Planctomycetaceae bacterium]|nr:WD40 repeat domain-containing protein [Planctomycetaceae bacterium]